MDKGLKEKGGMVLLWTFNSDIQAEQAKLLLESHGYFAHINNSYSTRFNYYESFVNTITSGIRLYTKKNQAYDAYVLLAMHDIVPMKDIITSSSSGIDGFQKFMSKVPVLSSMGIIGQIIVVGIAVTFILFLIIKV
ncbi:MAG: hypothetical protein CMD20_02470 [Flavobacteriales bacterium]|nr:hypothetical protein [Flavobacteriales bacterium]